MVVFVDYGYLDLQAEAARRDEPAATGPEGGCPPAYRPFPGWPAGMPPPARRPDLLCGADSYPDLEAFDGAPGIAEASYGPDVRPESPSDGAPRTPVGMPVPRPDTYPWRATVSLAITAADGSVWNGTGWFAGPRTVVTAAHSLYVHGSEAQGRDGWVRSVSVMPGRNGMTLPYGAISAHRQSFRVADGWVADRDSRANYGAIVLTKPVGRLTGWYGFGVCPDATILGSASHTAGYFADAPAGSPRQQAGVVTAVTANQVRCPKGTAGGGSGGALVRLVAGQPYVFAVHNYGGWYASLATRITPAVHRQLLRWQG